MLLRIGELARRAGVTVRTLHHYDALGLLCPRTRTEGGDRVYGQAEAMRLHAVLALKQFGCSLAEIRRLLDEDGATLPDILARQIAVLKEQADKAAALGEKLSRLRDRLLHNKETALGDWLDTLALMHVWSRYFTEDELARLRRHRSPGRERRKAWAGIAAAVAAAMAGQVAPESVEGLAIARRVVSLARTVAGDDPALLGKLRKLVRSEAGVRQAAGMSEPMLAWLERALDAARPASRPEAASGDATAPRQTAMGMAMLRAAHQLLDAPLVLDDPLALRIIGREREAALRADPGRYDGGELRGLRLSGALRSRVAEDAWNEARAGGVAQYVSLGAGLDTAPWRRGDGRTRFFEVDHPATQAWKRSLLAEAGLAVGDNVVFVPTDFESSRLAEVLAAAGFDCAAPAFFSWLGVTMYLEAGTILDILAWVATLPPGTRIVFDYAVEPSLLSPGECRGRERVAARAAARGEPWKSAFDPAALAAALLTLGFARVDDPGAPGLNARYLAGRADGLRKSGVTRIVRAVVDSEKS
ncbi:Transcriptional regulator, MerR family [Desulfovibrio sp. DV]|uniref:SAM-dependent methyltransferase n=1 Tax=Desulfovibrio sp. DV TaxID=1844708 RepID=UPI00094BB1D2|nr:SAM-dependent methyltransferase [Desulfovibrio sp. DV]OLN24719.1 Transcriptional regulator, MerR family [Desulfovibrio sp. DV]